MIAVLIILLSVLGALSYIIDIPLSAPEILQVMSDCAQSGLIYDNSSNISIPASVIHINKVSQRVSVDDTATFTEKQRVAYQNHSARLYRGVFIFEQACVPRETNGYTVFKRPVEHVTMINSLIACNRKGGIPHVKVGILSNEITEMSCGNI